MEREPAWQAYCLRQLQFVLLKQRLMLRDDPNAPEQHLVKRAIFARLMDCSDAGMSQEAKTMMQHEQNQREWETTQR